MKKWLKGALTRRNLIILVAILAVVGIGWRRQAAAQKKQAQVQIAQVKKGDVEQDLVVSGQIKAERVAKLTFPTSGKLAYVNVSEGDTVNYGQSLMGLDAGDLDSAVREAWYRYLAAEANAKLIEDEVKGHDSDESFTQKNARISAQAARDIAYDNWLEAKRARDKADLWSPVTGFVTQVTAKVPGAVVGLSDGAVVADASSVYFEALVDETDIQKARVGQAVKVNLSALEGTTLDGQVTAIGYQTQISDTGATVIPVKVKLSSEDWAKVRLGLTGDASLVLATAKNVLTLPIGAVNGNKVTLVDGRETVVKTGVLGENEVEITSGLKEGDQVAVK